MARTSSNQTVLTSLLDRLLDAESSRPRSASQAIRDYMQSVQRDLENLLNTRSCARAWPPSLNKDLDASLMNYGVPDFTGANLGASEGREEFRRVFEGVIRRFEPRLTKVKVTLTGNPESVDRTLRFRIEATLRVETSSEPVRFDTTLEPTTMRVKIQKAGQ